MKKIGYLLITTGFLAGSLFTVIDEVEVQWTYFVISLLLGIAGVVLVRVSSRRVVKEEGRLAGTLQQIENSLARIVENMGRLSAEKHELNPYDVRIRIDELLPEDINIFVEGRDTIAHIYGLQAYADMMSHFAAGERYLNRVWSASADGYIDEVHEYIEIAREQFVEALEFLNRTKSAATTVAAE